MKHSPLETMGVLNPSYLRLVLINPTNLFQLTRSLDEETGSFSYTKFHNYKDAAQCWPFIAPNFRLVQNLPQRNKRFSNLLSTKCSAKK